MCFLLETIIISKDPERFNSIVPGGGREGGRGQIPPLLCFLLETIIISEDPERFNPIVPGGGKGADSASFVFLIRDHNYQLKTQSDLTLLYPVGGRGEGEGGKFFVLPTTTQFSTPKNSSITRKFLERSGSFLSPSRIAQISQTKDTVGRLEAEFATFKLSIERRLLETVVSQLFQDMICSLTQSNNLETKTLKSRMT